MAKQMGLPIGLLCAGVNINDITNKVFQTGAIQKSNAPMRTTLSEAINIQLPYNLERLLFYLTGGDHSQVRKWYSGLETSGRTNLQTEWLERLQQEFRSARVTDEELCSTLKVTLETWGYWACPNTGVAFAAAKQLNYFDDANEKTVALLATASPCKFQEAVTVALGQQKWKEYEQNHFPALGKQIMRNPEQPPIIYRTTAGKTLKENQVEWERMARELIKNL